MTEQPHLSVIVPFYNEEGNVRGMHAAITKAVDPLGVPYEMVFVNDGSQDRTLEIAIEIAREDPRLRIVNLRRNFGQTSAMSAGIDDARGKVLVTMDGDLQNDPCDIEHLLAKINEGYDLVIGWRFNRQDKLMSRKIPSRMANWLIGKLTGVPVKDSGCSLKAYRASVIKRIPLYAEMHRFIPAMASISGARMAEIKVRHHARRSGQSKYGLSRVYKVLLDILVIKTVTTFAARPLAWFSLIAIPLLLLGVASMTYSLLQLMSGSDSLPIAGTGIIFVMSGIVLLFGGVLGEFVYQLGDVREHGFSRLTSTVYGSTAASTKKEAPAA